MLQNVNENIYADVRAVNEYNHKNGTRLSYRQYKLIFYLDSIKKKKSLHRKSGPPPFSQGRQSGEIIEKRKAAKEK